MNARAVAWLLLAGVVLVVGWRVRRRRGLPTVVEFLTVVVMFLVAQSGMF